jgi:hypothetical protein
MIKRLASGFVFRAGAVLPQTGPAVPSWGRLRLGKEKPAG